MVLIAVYLSINWEMILFGTNLIQGIFMMRKLPQKVTGRLFNDKEIVGSIAALFCLLSIFLQIHCWPQMAQVKKTPFQQVRKHIELPVWRKPTPVKSKALGWKIHWKKLSS